MKECDGVENNGKTSIMGCTLEVGIPWECEIRSKPKGLSRDCGKSGPADNRIWGQKRASPQMEVGRGAPPNAKPPLAGPSFDFL